MIETFEKFDTIDCSDISTDFIRDILLEDLYEYSVFF